MVDYSNLEEIVSIVWDVSIAAEEVPHDKEWSKLDLDEKLLIMERVEYFLDEAGLIELNKG